MSRLDPKTAGVLALAVVTAVLVAWLFVRDPAQPSSVATPQPTSSAPAMATPSQDAALVSLWLGDSYTGGTGAKSPREGEACLTAEALGWVCQLDAQGGTGFVADGHVNSVKYSPLGDRLDATIAKHPDVDVVVIDAGRNDYTAPKARVKAAAQDYFDRVEQAWPDAQIVVIAPWFLGREDRPLGGWFAPWEKALAKKHHAAFVDPFADGWTTKDLTGKDGLHPTPEGYAWIAEHLAPAIQAAMK